MQDEQSLSFTNSSMALENNGQVLLISFFREGNIGTYTCRISWRDEIDEASAELALKSAYQYVLIALQFIIYSEE